MINKILKTAFFLGTLAIFFQNGDIITNSVKTGLELCYSAVIPSLFIFMVLSAVLSQSVGAKIVALPLWPYAKLLKAKDAGKTAGYIFLALLGGFSAGSMMLGKIKQSCKDSNRLSVLAIAMVNNSPSFCIMTVGFILLGNKNIGVLLFVSLTLASLIVAFVFSFILKYEYISFSPDEKSDRTSFVDCVKNAVTAMTFICGFVVFFNCLCSVILKYINFPFSILPIALSEVTYACKYCAENAEGNIYLICFLLSILPISTLCQVYGFVGDKTVIKNLILSRFIHTPVSLTIFSLLLHVFPNYSATSATDIISVRKYRVNAEASLILFLIAVLFIIIFDKNKLFTKFSN